MKKSIFLFFLSLNFFVKGQETFTIDGHFPNYPNSKFELKGFEGLQNKVLAVYTSKEDCKFKLTYPKDYRGVAHLYMNGSIAALLFLNQENFTIYWEDLTQRDEMKVYGSKEYDDFLKGMKTFQEADAKLAGWHYLLPLYESDSIKQSMVARELQEVTEMFPNYVKSLPENRWVRHYLLAKGLTSQMPSTVQNYPWRAPAHIVEFHGIDFRQHKNSGLIKEIVEGYTNLVERFPLEDIYPLFEHAIDKVISELDYDPTTQQEIAEQWFNSLESKSLFKAAEYLALKMLNQDNCMLNDKTTAMFEQYRKLAIGKTAPNIYLGTDLNLSDLANTFKLVVFGASWCPSCQTDYTLLVEKYPVLKEKYNLEIIYIALDTDKKAFETYYEKAPFLTFCDAKGWETQAAKAYHVFATPTYMLLDRQLQILAKIQSPVHLEAWLESQRR